MWCIVHYRYLHYSFTDAVRSQDTLYVVRSVSNNIYGRSITWNFLRNNWAALKDRYYTYVCIYVRSVRSAAMVLTHKDSYIDHNDNLICGITILLLFALDSYVASNDLQVAIAT